MANCCSSCFNKPEFNNNDIYKPEKKYYNNGLNKNQQNILYDISRECYYKATTHQAEARKYHCLNKWLGLIISINIYILGGNSWLLLVTNIDKDNPDFIYSLVFSILTIINIVAVTLSNVLVPLYRSSKHHSSYLEFLSILREANMLHRQGKITLDVNDIIIDLRNQVTECETTSLPV